MNQSYNDSTRRTRGARFALARFRWSSVGEIVPAAAINVLLLTGETFNGMRVDP